MTATIQSRLRSRLTASIMTIAAMVLLQPAIAQEGNIADYKSSTAAQSFDDPAKAVDAFKATLAANDFDGLAKLLGLDAAKLRSSEGVVDTFDKIRKGAAETVVVDEAAADRRIIEVGKQAWPFPFPITKNTTGKWAFNADDGLGEIVNRRIGENEIQAVETVRAYVDAQRVYAAQDRSGDGVLKYAQKLISSEGRADGLYWPTDDVNGESPAGDSINDAALEKAKQGNGYYGYRFRILKGQGSNVAGGQYDYVINGNMIAGFGLIAWPVTYGKTGVDTFVVNQAGIVYEKDLGPQTSTVVGTINRFNPDKSWKLSGE
jgi:hypothetical protein